MKKLAFLTIFLAFAAVLAAEGPAASPSTEGIIYGADWSLAVKAPSGWILDQKSLATQGIFGLFYERGRSLDESTPVIYIVENALPKPTDEALAAYAKKDSASYASSLGATAASRKLDAAALRGGIAYDIDAPSAKEFETVAYLRCKGSVCLVVLTARDASTRNSLIGKLEETLSSFTFADKKAE